MKPFYLVLFTGDRNWSNSKPVKRVLEKLQARHDSNLAVISGGARGLDTIVKNLCLQRGIPFAEVEAQWDFFGRSAGPIRNVWMLRFGKVCEAHAFHPNLKRSKGTRNMVGHCERFGIKCKVHSK